MKKPEKKYELIEESMQFKGSLLHRIRALRDFDEVKAGDLGGWIESEMNLSHNGNCWVYNEAKVFGYAHVSGNASIHNSAEICEGARVFDKAIIYDDVKVYNVAQVYGAATIEDAVQISGEAQVYGNAEISGGVRIEGNAIIFGEAAVYGNGTISDNAYIENISDVLFVGPIFFAKPMVRTMMTTFYKSFNNGTYGVDVYAGYHCSLDFIAKCCSDSKYKPIIDSVKAIILGE